MKAILIELATPVNSLWKYPLLNSLLEGRNNLKWQRCFFLDVYEAHAASREHDASQQHGETDGYLTFSFDSESTVACFHLSSTLEQQQPGVVQRMKGDIHHCAPVHWHAPTLMNRYLPVYVADTDKTLPTSLTLCYLTLASITLHRQSEFLLATRPYFWGFALPCTRKYSLFLWSADLTTRPSL